MLEELRNHVAAKIGAIAKPANVVFTPELPKTRRGKIMRRLLRDVAENRPLGDTTTLADPAVVTEPPSGPPQTPQTTSAPEARHARGTLAQARRAASNSLLVDSLRDTEQTMLRRIVLAAVLIASVFVGIVAGWQYGLARPRPRRARVRCCVQPRLQRGSHNALELDALWERSRGREPLEPDGWQTQALTRSRLESAEERSVARSPGTLWLCAFLIGRCLAYRLSQNADRLGADDHARCGRGAHLSSGGREADRIPTSSMEPTLHCAKAGRRLQVASLRSSHRQPTRLPVPQARTRRHHRLQDAAPGQGSLPRRRDVRQTDRGVARGGGLDAGGTRVHRRRRLAEPYLRPAYRGKESGSWRPSPNNGDFLLGETEPRPATRAAGASFPAATSSAGQN